MKLWHDDIRVPPDDTWVWARTNEEAIEILQNHNVEIASLDHDLGLETVDPNEENAWLRKGQGVKTGLHLAWWMHKHPDRIPPKIIIHSWNIVGADLMASVLKSHTQVVLQPYTRSNPPRQHDRPYPLEPVHG